MTSHCPESSVPPPTSTSTFSLAVALRTLSDHCGCYLPSRHTVTAEHYVHLHSVDESAMTTAARTRHTAAAGTEGSTVSAASPCIGSTAGSSLSQLSDTAVAALHEHQAQPMLSASLMYLIASGELRTLFVC